MAQVVLGALVVLVYTLILTVFGYIVGRKHGYDQGFKDQRRFLAEALESLEYDEWDYEGKRIRDRLVRVLRAYDKIMTRKEDHDA